MLLLWIRGVRFMYSVDPLAAAGHQAALAGLLPRGAPGLGARADCVPPGHRRLLQAGFSPLAAGRGGAAVDYLARLARRARVALS